MKIYCSNAVKAAGSVSALARAIHVRPQAISQWEEIPVDRVPAVERATGVGRHILRPDLWDAPPRRRKRASLTAAVAD